MGSAVQGVKPQACNMSQAQPYRPWHVHWKCGRGCPCAAWCQALQDTKPGYSNFLLKSMMLTICLPTAALELSFRHQQPAVGCTGHVARITFQLCCQH